MGMIKIKNVTFPNPVWTSSGTAGFGEELNNLIDLNLLGAFVTKGLTLNPITGYDGLRIVETPSGLINRIGLQNPGLQYFINKIIPFYQNFNIPVIVNIAGFSIEEFCQLIRALDKYEKIKGFEINVSCPNVKKGGIFFSSDRKLFELLLKSIRKETKKLIIVKLSPSEGNMKEFTKISESEGADAVTISNTFKAMVIDTKTGDIKIRGGLSGPAIFPIVLNFVYEISKITTLPVIASGGIYNVDVAKQFLIAGAKAIQIGTYGFVNPRIYEEIIKNL